MQCDRRLFLRNLTLAVLASQLPLQVKANSQPNSVIKPPRVNYPRTPLTLCAGLPVSSGIASKRQEIFPPSRLTSPPLAVSLVKSDNIRKATLRERFANIFDIFCSVDVAVMVGFTMPTSPASNIKR